MLSREGAGGGPGDAPLDEAPGEVGARAPGTDHDALVAALLEVERHVGAAGWDQPARLFALVPTARLLAAEPTLADRLGVAHPDDHLSSIEQDGFHEGRDLLQALAHIAWPPAVTGCVLAVERSFLPAGLEAEIPPEGAAEFVAAHPERHDVRVVTGATRDGARHSVARLRSHPAELLGGEAMVPGLAAALAATLD